MAIQLISGLSLSRREGETIAIGKDVVVQVASVRGGKVQLKVSAPKSVPVLRGELVGTAASRPMRDQAAA